MDINNDLVVKKDIDIEGKLNLTGNLDIESDIICSTDKNKNIFPFITQNITIGGNGSKVISKTDMDINNDLVVKNNLNVLNETTFDKKVVAKKILGVTENLDLSGDMVIKGDIEANVTKPNHIYQRNKSDYSR